MSAYKSTRVLILDDEPVIVDTLCMILNQCGFEALGVYGHNSALAASRQFQPHAFLTGFTNDCEVNGCETAAELLTLLPQCRVAIFSGSRAAGPVIEEYRRRGYDFDVLAKPLHPQDLLTWLRSYEPPAPEPDDSLDPQP
jgi:DNA-binding NtrC family response regulator